MKKTDTIKDLAFYLSLPYTTVLRRDEEGDVIARVDELPGCMAHGKNEMEALNNLADIKQLWIQDSIEAAHTVPEPEVEPLPSGKWVQRAPRNLHRKLVRMAKNENVSLNQLVTSILSERLGARAIEMAVERMIGSFVSSPHLPGKHYWDTTIPIAPSHWPPNLAGRNSCLRNVGNLLPATFQVNTDNVSEHEEYFFTAPRRQ
jgi:antitoxin HicB